MNFSSVFWASFLAGLAGPATLYAAPATYPLYLGGSTVALSFSNVGLLLDCSIGVYLNVRTPSIGQSGQSATEQTG
jgi:hypothetical protein